MSSTVTPPIGKCLGWSSLLLDLPVFVLTWRLITSPLHSCSVRCSSLTQTLSVSNYEWEIIFDILIIIAGLLLFAFLIGNMQVRTMMLQLHRILHLVP